MDRSGDPQPSHLGQQGRSLQSSFAAAPRGLPTIQPNRSSVSTIMARSESSNVIDDGKQETMLSGGRNLHLPFVERVWEHSVPRKDNSALHQVLCSRMLPGQEYHWKAPMVSGGIVSTCFPMRWLNCFTKCVTRREYLPGVLLTLAERLGTRSADSTDHCEIDRARPSSARSR